MTRLARFGFYAMAAAWLGCGGSVVEETGVIAREATTPGGQTPIPRSNPPPPDLPYYEYLPPGYGTGARFPLLVFFHGIGECGDGSPTQLPKVLRHGPPKLIEGGKDFPAIVISPQLPCGSRWSEPITTPFVDYLLAHYDVDPARVYITGLSLGGEGTWRYARSHPSTVAAIVPICGPKYGTGYSVLRGMPIWVFHRLGDQTVPISHSVNLLAEVTGIAPPIDYGATVTYTYYFNGTTWNKRPGELPPQVGENPTFTVYPGSSHDAWTAAYNNQGMWNWFFAQNLPNNPDDIVFQQDFQSSTVVSSYVNSTNPSDGQFNDISAEPNGGTFSINSGQLRLVRTGSSATDNNAGITRWTDFVGPPTLLHVTFDLGVSGWTVDTSQSNALLFTVGNYTGFIPYNSGGAAVSAFHTISVKGEGSGNFVVMTLGIKSPLLATNGALHRVSVFLNKSGASASYRAPNGSLQTLSNLGVALWVDTTPVVTNGAAANGSESTLTDFRIYWPHPENATWLLDNFLIKKSFPP